MMSAIYFKWFSKTVCVGGGGGRLREKRDIRKENKTNVARCESRDYGYSSYYSFQFSVDWVNCSFAEVVAFRFFSIGPIITYSCSDLWEKFGSFIFIPSLSVMFLHGGWFAFEKLRKL